MAIQGVDTKCYILALFVRDDGERFLLGSGHYEFKNTQMHFAANAIQNDIVEVQGNDGFLLAGQVRRPGTQSFDGYVGDGTMSKEETESYRRQFFSFFRKNFFYKVIYVFSDGTAIQRKSGFLVDDPTVQELYQMYPEYHVALNFEDVNYYSYSEDEEGQEQYAKEATIDTSSMRATGGLVWDNLGVVWEATQWGGEQTASGTEMTIQNDMSVMSRVDDIRLDGDTEQQTYRGFQLLQKQGLATPSTDTTFWYAISNQTITALEDGWARFTSSSSSATKNFFFNRVGGFSWEVGATYTVICEIKNAPSAGRITFSQPQNTTDPFASVSVGVQADYTFDGTDHTFVFSGTTKANHVSMGLRPFFNTYFTSGSSVDLRLTIVAGDHTADYQNYIDDNWEPYVGGIPSPNPDYPQEIQTVTGVQTVAVSGKNLFNWAGLSEASGDYVNATLGEWGAKGIVITGNTSTGSEFASSRGVFRPTASSTNSQYRVPLLAGSTITISADVTLLEDNYRPNIRISLDPGGIAGNSIALVLNETVRVSQTFSNIAEGTYRPTFSLNSNKLKIENIQIEAGSTSTAYELYQSHDYTVDLGATELCKLGDYQDYIYKGADGWYLHKEIDYIDLYGKRVTSTTFSDLQFYYMTGYDALDVMCTHFTGVAYDRITANGTAYTYMNDGQCAFRGGTSKDRVYFKTSKFASSADMTTWLASNHMLLYYIIATPTDTKITDNTLAGQLNALGAMRLFIGENNLAVQDTGTNLPAPLSFKYYTTVAMTGAVWEEGGSGGATVVEVDSITNTYPIWRVKGPAVNPQLSVINTNTTIRYTGTVTSTQTLEIDMFNKTAKLNGVSVIGNVSGDWVSLAPGTNRVIYTAENADAQPSTIEWQEVVG